MMPQKTIPAVNHDLTNPAIEGFEGMLANPPKFLCPFNKQIPAK